MSSNATVHNADQPPSGAAHVSISEDVTALQLRHRTRLREYFLLQSHGEITAASAPLLHKALVGSSSDSPEVMAFVEKYSASCPPAPVIEASVQPQEIILSDCTQPAVVPASVPPEATPPVPATKFTKLSLHLPTSAFFAAGREPMPDAAEPIYDLVAYGMRVDKVPLHSLLQTACKSLCAPDWQAARTELLAAKILGEIEAMRSANKWSARQPKRFLGPARTKTHRDFLLDEAKWMAMDYRQERKWKLTMAYALSQEVLQWHQRREQNGQHDDSENGYNTVQSLDSFQLEPQVPPLVYDEGFRPKSRRVYRRLSETPRTERRMDTTESVPVVPLSRLLHMPTELARPPPIRDEKRLIVSAERSQSVFYVPNVPEMKSLPPPPTVPVTVAQAGNRQLPTWSVEEEEFLLNHVTAYNFNWSLLAEELQSLTHAPADHKCPWDAWQKWDQLRKSSKEERLREKEKDKTRRDDLKRQASRHQSFFDQLHRACKKRDAAQQKLLAQTNAAAARQQKGTSMSAHVSHQAIAARAGVDPRRYRTPLDHNDRRLKLQKMSEMQRNNPLSLMQQQQLLQQTARSQRAPMPLSGPPSAHPMNNNNTSSNSPAIMHRPPVTNGNNSNSNINNNSNSNGSQNSAHGPPMNGAHGRPPQMTMTQAQVQQFLQRQALLRQSQQPPGSPAMSPASSTGAQMNGLMPMSQAQLAQMPHAVTQRLLLARQQQQQQMMNQQLQHQQQQQQALLQQRQQQTVDRTNGSPAGQSSSSSSAAPSPQQPPNEPASSATAASRPSQRSSSKKLTVPKTATTRRRSKSPSAAAVTSSASSSPAAAKRDSDDDDTDEDVGGDEDDDDDDAEATDDASDDDTDADETSPPPKRTSMRPRKRLRK